MRKYRSYKILARWRTLYREARASLSKASQSIESGLLVFGSDEYRQQKRLQDQASIQLKLLKNESSGNGTEMTEFYVFRYLASEGFLPGYNFTRLPVRVFVSEGDGGDYISRPRLVALREFGPGNIIYHNGAKFRINQIIQPEIPTQLRAVRVCTSSGYWLADAESTLNCCPFTGVDLTESKNREDFIDVLPLTECKADVREYITCEEEERRRLGFEIETYFSVPDGDMSRVQRAVVRSGGDDLLNLAFIPAARLVQLNRRDRGRKDEGFPLGMNTGFWKSNNPGHPGQGGDSLRSYSDPFHRRRPLHRAGEKPRPHPRRRALPDVCAQARHRKHLPNRILRTRSPTHGRGRHPEPVPLRSQRRQPRRFVRTRQ